MAYSNGCYEVEKWNFVIRWSKLTQLGVRIWFLAITAVFVQNLAHYWFRVAILGSKKVILAQKAMVHYVVTIMIRTPSWCFSVILWYRLSKYAIWKKSVTCYNFTLVRSIRKLVLRKRVTRYNTLEIHIASRVRVSVVHSNLFTGKWKLLKFLVKTLIKDL